MDEETRVWGSGVGGGRGKRVIFIVVAGISRTEAMLQKWGVGWCINVCDFLFSI